MAVNPESPKRLDPAAPALAPRTALLLSVGLVGTAVLLHLIHRGSDWFETWTDEVVHLYVAQRISSGAVLYRDVHSARPPLSIGLLASVLKLGLSPLAAARGLVVGSSVATAAILYWAGRRTWGLLAGSSAAVLFLLSAELAARSTFTGIHLSALWTTLCAVLAIQGRPIWAGVAAGLALATGQHALVVTGLAGLLLLRHGWREPLRYGAAILAVLVLTFGGALALGGTGIWDDLIGKHLYHLKGTQVELDGDLGWWLECWALDNATVLLLGSLGLLLALRRAPGRKGLSSVDDALWYGAFATLHATVVMAMKGGLILYLHPAVPIWTLVAGYGCQRGWEVLSNRGGRRLWAGAALGVLAAVTVAGWAGARTLYVKRDKQPYPLLPHQRFLQMARITRVTVADKIAPLARELPPDRTVFGQPNIASLVALRANRRVSGELSDLAERWIVLGSVSRESVVERIEADRVGLFVTPRWFYLKDPFFRSYLERCYDKPLVFPREKADGQGIPDILAFRRDDSKDCTAVAKP